MLTYVVTEAKVLRKYSARNTPVRLNLGIVSIYLVSSPQDVRDVMYNLQTFSDHSLRARFIGNVLGVPRNACKVIEADNSGSKDTSLNENVPPSRRIVYMQQKGTLDGLMTQPTIQTFIGQTTHALDRLVIASGIGENWKVQSDLFTFIRDLSSTAIINALCGPSLLQQCPTFMESFWEFDANVHWLHIGVPRILRRSAYEARDGCQMAVKEWQRQAVVKSKDVTYPEVLLWDEIWGMKMMRNRQDMYNQFPEFDAQAKAGADLGILWA
jgi:hypothetical protein